ncbi:hypothetical protein [bacterium endosymbiont of Bathymodiolus sp. 5 South]|jgi:hypothetical protein|uniref:hypothetical protein n=1 Tax=bacterium endosymbiont of Bathymodiolus sp. 5 South TaxID=1181670 RepID=UPI0010B9ED65|nr:hypothetical protein [bacterium endosymbiont of Bathymodiolus sp. 5 South]CAC9642050.1 hypothetical protein [uncultured Gammaproteobacteria bacterium]CAC9644621.1 hypothetical protein [uncultured Gammaproteobacteria bacterium]SHN93660.1 hypothetical protein BCLUESOX_835 [bacterium endosymbiont of Bathymodiolus sp. 5 South]SSC09182.1 hypothetical protein BTURTLESOX_1366 [bacterium endosymbiont of Bathymodiolus sp. 5 South]VVH57687.1 hypothetical protein BSPCLSOX_1811 [uncultured Gammaproteob
MRKKLITLTLLAIIANVTNGAKLQTNKLIHSDAFNKNWKTIITTDERIQQQNKFKSCRIVSTTKFMDENKESDVMWKGGCSDFIDKYGSTKGNKPNKGWTTTVSKDFGGLTLESQQRNKSKTCRIVRRKEDQSTDVMWSGSCVELMTMNYKGTKFTKGWTTVFLSHANIQKHDRLKSYRIVDSVGYDSVGAVWTGSYDEVINEFKTRTRFKNQKYASFLRKQIRK